MSESNPWKMPEKRARRMARDPAYQNIVQQLLYNCRAKTSHDSVSIEPPAAPSEERHMYFDPYFEDEVTDPDTESEWDDLSITILQEGQPDANGVETLAVVDLTQELTEDFDFLKRYLITFVEGRYRVMKQNMLYDHTVDDTIEEERGFVYEYEFGNSSDALMQDLEELDQIIDQTA